MANAEDLNRLTVCALVLLGHIFLSLGNSKESMNMVNPAMQLSSKIPDTHVQLWASAILKGTSFHWFLLFQTWSHGMLTLQTYIEWTIILNTKKKGPGCTRVSVRHFCKIISVPLNCRNIISLNGLTALFQHCHRLQSTPHLFLVLVEIFWKHYYWSVQFPIESWFFVRTSSFRIKSLFF